jgi:hypothetical protein
LSESAEPIGCQQHLGCRLKFSLNTSYGAVFFFGVSSPGSTSASAPCSSLFHQVGFNQVIWRSILHGAVQANPFQRPYFVVTQAAGIAGFMATAQQKV